MRLEDIIITPEGKQGPRYRSMHDARPTAPTGTIWRVSKIVDEIVHLYAENGWGRFIEATCRPEQLFDDVGVPRACTAWERVAVGEGTSTFLRGTHAVWSRLMDGAHIFKVLPLDCSPGPNDGGYKSIESALKVKGMLPNG